MAAEKTVKLIAQIPEDLHVQLKDEAKRDDRSINAVVRLALRAYFADAKDNGSAAPSPAR